MGRAYESFHFLIVLIYKVGSIEDFFVLGRLSLKLNSFLIL